MTDANVWMAIAAVTTVLFQVIVAAYFYGTLNQRVRMMQEAAEEQREAMRQTLAELKQEIAHLRDKLYYKGYTRDRTP
jgi:hypothetical protein